MKYFYLLFALFFVQSDLLFAQEKAEEFDYLKFIREEGIDRGQVMDFASYLCDDIGPRLSGSYGMEKANNWAVQKLKSMGLVNVEKEAWGEFGRGWELKHFEIHVDSPHYWNVIAYPKAWSPSTNGEVKGDVVYLKASTLEDLEQYRGKLKGKFVFLDTIRNTQEWFAPPASRYESDDLLEMANAPYPTPRPRRNWQTGGFNFNRAMWMFLKDEKPACVVDRAYKGDLGTVFVAGAIVSSEERKRPQELDSEILPQVTMSVEHYNRILRLLNKGQKIQLRMNLKSEYSLPNNGLEYNVLGEIEGSDLKDEVVMFGAHMDSWHSATGATDNGAGTAVMFEVARILQEMIKESGVKPRRTLRIALWSGEEQGIFGSINYVRKHLAETEPGGWIPKATKPDHSKISAYYNLDNGTGKIRGIHLQGNEAVAPIFRAWMDNFKDLEGNTLTLNNTGGTDHLAFDGVGIPGFQFIQDPVAYFNRTHHSNMDNFDHLIGDDLKQAATIIATMVWLTAQRDEMIPRKPLKLLGDSAN